MSTASFKYNRTDFRPLPVKLDHLDIHLNFIEGRVEGTITLSMTARERIDHVQLDAKDIDVTSVSLLHAGTTEPLPYDHQKDKCLLVITLPQTYEPGHRLCVQTTSICIPTQHILDGIYTDTSPAGAPQQYMSQCQQWGFQRILPIFDDCTAKCTLVTTLEADARYTHLISNGNVRRATNPDGRPVLKPGQPDRKVITYENDIPMAPYLFIAAVGTWDVLEDSIVYPNGRRVALEYLVPPGRIEGARIPMTILKESVLWTYDTQEYEYTRDVYRTICMEKSNFGGMENVGNTTIITDAALIDPFTGDRRIEYAHGVIVHEFEHNQCGSEVTMETPFDMWLNEAFTVDVERQFLMSQFDPACVRLDEVDSMRAPLSGPLAIEDGGHMGNIVRDGFNDPDELVDGVTYVKAAEVIRMLRLIIGAETFLCAKNLYFKRHKGGNANTDQFFACFEELSGRDLSMFKREWLYTIGYPQVEASHHFDEAERLLHLELRQTRAGCGGVFHVPVEIAAFNGDGQTIPGTVRTLELTGAQARFTLECAEGPAFLSISRSCSFYGTFRHAGVTREELLNQIRFDTDGFNRVEAMRQLTDIERIKLIRDPDAMVSPEWVAAYRGILNDPAIPVGLRGYLLRIEESSLVREYLPCYRERYAARLRLLKTLAQEMLPDLVRAFQGVDTYRRSEDPKAGIEERRLKALLLRTIVEAGTPAVWKLAEDHFEKAWHISDRIAALNCINMTDSPNRLARLADGYTSWKDHLSAYTAYLQIVSSGIHDDIFGMIATEEQRPEFNIQHPTHNRALYLPMAANNKMLWTDRGIAWLTETVTRLATINENSSIRMLSCYQLVQKMPADMKAKVLDSLRTLKTRIKKDDAPSVHGRIAAYLGE